MSETSGAECPNCGKKTIVVVKQPNQTYWYTAVCLNCGYKKEFQA